MEVVVLTSHRSRAGTSLAAAALASAVSRAGQAPLLAELGSFEGEPTSRAPDVDHRRIEGVSELVQTVREASWPVAVLDLGDLRRTAAREALAALDHPRLIFVVPMEADAVAHLDEAAELVSSMRREGTACETLGIIATRVPHAGAERELADHFVETCAGAVLMPPVVESSEPERAYDEVSQEIVRSVLPEFWRERPETSTPVAEVAGSASSEGEEEAAPVESGGALVPLPSAFLRTPRGFPDLGAARGSQYTFVVEPGSLGAEVLGAPLIQPAFLAPTGDAQRPSAASSGPEARQGRAGNSSRTRRWFFGALSFAVFCLVGLITWLTAVR